MHFTASETVKFNSPLDGKQFFLSSINSDNLRLEVLDNHLYIHQMMEIDQNSSEKAPYVISMIPLIRQINIDAISATFEDGWTVIKLPFDEMVNGQERQIKIERR